MPNDSINPYEANLTPHDPILGEQSDSGIPLVLGRRFARLVANIVDGFLLMIFMIAVALFAGTGLMGMPGLGQLDQNPGASVVLLLLIAFVPWIAFFVINGYFLQSRGQTLGKMATNVQIVDYKTDRIMGLNGRIFLRFLWTVPLSLIAELVGSGTPQLISFVYFVGVLLIFSPSRRCLHDYIAGTHVVEYRPDRPKLNDSI
ncbi:MAG: RDD family protein [Planctomycetota bacterium]|jgi:uncharacterized RDD family membrane protein YckC